MTAARNSSVRLLVLTLALASLACTPANTGDKSDPNQPTAQAVDLSGYWRVAELDGAAIDGGHAITLKANHEQIWWEPACAGQSESYRITGSRFETISYDDGPTMVCDIGYPDALPRVFSALRAADTIARTPDNGVRISGKGRSVTLFSQ